ncbi:MAG: hypothetical protein AB7O62_09185 [Pirellulales bacterium]
MTDQRIARVSRRSEFWRWTAAITLLVEVVTLLLRFGGRMTAVEFNRTAPLLLQIHHMFWAVPLLVLAALTRRWPAASLLLAASAVACILSDLIHHFIVLQLLVGHAGWHWP